MISINVIVRFIDLDLYFVEDTFSANKEFTSAGLVPQTIAGAPSILVLMKLSGSKTNPEQTDRLSG